MNFRIVHRTSYDYKDPVALCHSLLHLKPRERPGQICRRHRLSVAPEPKSRQEGLDYFGNPICSFSIQEPHRRLEIAAEQYVQVDPVRAGNGSDGPQPTVAYASGSEAPAWEQVRDAVRTSRERPSIDAFQYTLPSTFIPLAAELAEYARTCFPPGQSVLAGVSELTKRIHDDFVYDPAATTLSTPVLEVFARKRGVCQDFAHVEIACLRVLGLPGRYVSGYVLTHPRTGQPRLVGADASHAWIAVYASQRGWVDYDPTNNLQPTDQHITLAWGRDYEDVSPVKGIILGGGSHTMRVSVDVAPVPD